jgi:hypothetical protein
LTTQALIAVLIEAIIDANNRWRKVERANDKMKLQSIRDVRGDPENFAAIFEVFRRDTRYARGGG